jgi:hypothetical protein
MNTGLLLQGATHIVICWASVDFQDFGQFKMSQALSMAIEDGNIPRKYGQKYGTNVAPI